MQKLQKPLIWILIAFSTLGLFYKLDQQYLWTDEVFTFHAAQRIEQTGEAIFETGFPYERSPIYHQLVSNSMSVLDNDIWASRVINIPFILLTALILYLLQRDQKDFRKKAVPVLLYLSTNLTLAMARETRMYSMTTALFSLMLFAFYKAYVNPNKKFTLRLWKLEYKIDILWSILFIVIFLIGIYHHPILLLVGVILFVYFIAEAFFEKKTSNILILLGLVTAALGYIYIQFGELNTGLILSTFNPGWGESSYIYYLILIGRNLPWILALSPLIIRGVLSDRSRKGLFVNISLATYLVLISLSETKHERYLQLIIPLLILQSINYIFAFKPVLEKQTLFLRRTIKVVIITLVLSTHSYLYFRELNEITKYTSHSIAQQKKYDFEKAIEFTSKYKDAEIIADFHSAFTLISQGVEVKKILVTKDHPELARGDTDVYYGIEFITYPEELINELSDEELDILIIRDIETYPEINQELMREVSGFKKPKVYLER